MPGRVPGIHVCAGVRAVITSAAKQSIHPLCRAMDCFAEPVIGRAFADPLARNDGPNVQHNSVNWNSQAV
jgi:hypothetical protein